MTNKTRQQAHQDKKQKDGWRRVSALLEPEYVAMWKALGEKHGTIADAMRHLAKSATGKGGT